MKTLSTVSTENPGHMIAYRTATDRPKRVIVTPAKLTAMLEKLEAAGCYDVNVGSAFHGETFGAQVAS